MEYAVKSAGSTSVYKSGLGGHNADKMHSRVAVIGSGLIGQQWSMLLVAQPCSVVVLDIDPTQLTRASTAIRERLEHFCEQSICRSPDDVETQLGRLTFTSRWEEIPTDLDFVIECVPEDLALKRQTFGHMTRHFGASSVLLSSTSYLPISSIVEGLSTQERCLVAHPVNPPYFLRLVELCPSSQTSTVAVTSTQQLMRHIGQQTILMRREVPGFCVNRIQSAVINSALRLMQDDIIGAADVDLLLTEGLAPRWTLLGPLAVIATNGPGTRRYLDRFLVSVDNTNQQQGYPAQHSPELLQRLCAETAHLDEEGALAAATRYRDVGLGKILKLKQDHPYPRTQDPS